MKLQFKKQAYQSAAVAAIADCFAGQPKASETQYRVDPGRAPESSDEFPEFKEVAGFRNADLAITKTRILENAQSVQRRNNLPPSVSLVGTNAAPIKA
jgi:type III restriction enzyme